MHIEVQELLKRVTESVISLNTQQNVLLDAVEKYQTLSTGKSKSDCLKRKDLLASVDALGKLPYDVAHRLEHWMAGEQPMVSAEGFEREVLVEFAINLQAIYTFMRRENIELIGFDPALVKASLGTIQLANRVTAQLA